DSRMRGHSSLPAAVDTELRLAREGEIATLTVEMMRDGVEGTEVTMRAKSIPIGVDVRGKDRTSLVMVPVDDGEAVVKPSRFHEKRPWPKSLNVFHKAVSESMSEVGFDFQITGGPLVRAVDVKRVRERFLQTYTTEGEKKARQVAWKRALERAQQ